MLQRIFDITISLSFLIILSPLLFITAIAIWFTLGRPIIFTQERPGLNGNIFKIYKFRTMKNLHLDHGIIAPDQERLTPIGNLLRKTSIDEIPQLLNVIKGEMSLVGPRPLLTEYLPLYSTEQMRRHDVLPGITGWAQIKGRNGLSWQKKFELDIWYVNHQSFILDLQIIFLTIIKIFTPKGETLQGHIMSTKFEGNSNGSKNDK